MKEEWRKFLKDAGAEFDGNRISTFGNIVAEHKIAQTGNIITDLSYRGLIAVYGDDAQEFMQNQFCNDVRQANLEHSQLNAYCSAKGRTQALFRLTRRQASYYLSLPHDILESTMKRLRMFVLRSKLTLEDATDSFVRIGFAGPQADKLLAEAVGNIPQEVDSCVQTEILTIVRVGGSDPRFEIWGELEDIQKLWTELDVHAAPVASSIWEWLDIHAGIPTVVSATVDAFIPQMLNLEVLDGVSFQKGCYPGQEVVARMRYLGKLKRRMYLAHVDTDQAPQAGDELLSDDAESGQGAGKIVNVHAGADGGYDLLAVIIISVAESNKITLNDTNATPLEIKPLPYTFETLGKVKAHE